MAIRGRQPPKKVCFGNGLPVKLKVQKRLGRGTKIGFYDERVSSPWREQDTLVYVYVPWQIPRNRDFRTSDFAMVRSQSRLKFVGAINELTYLFIVLPLLI